MPYESELQTERDMSLQRNIDEALYKLDRCKTDAEFAKWARSYGYPCIKRAQERVGGQ